jgi:hypothetical protein
MWLTREAQLRDVVSCAWKSVQFRLDLGSSGYGFADVSR